MKIMTRILELLLKARAADNSREYLKHLCCLKSSENNAFVCSDGHIMLAYSELPLATMLDVNVTEVTYNANALIKLIKAAKAYKATVLDFNLSDDSVTFVSKESETVTAKIPTEHQKWPQILKLYQDAHALENHRYIAFNCDYLRLICQFMERTRELAMPEPSMQNRHCFAWGANINNPNAGFSAYHSALLAECIIA